jgi:hypothetical protein
VKVVVEIVVEIVVVVQVVRKVEVGPRLFGGGVSDHMTEH